MAAKNTLTNSGRERAFKLETTPITFGPGASEEAGWEMKRLGAGRVMVVSDPGVVRAGITGKVGEILEAEGIEFIGTIHEWEPTGEAWSHFRAPDGNVYEITQPPKS